MKFINYILFFIFSPFYTLIFPLLSINSLYLDSPYFYNFILLIVLIFNYLKNPIIHTRIIFLLFLVIFIFFIEYFNFLRYNEYYRTLEIGFFKLIFYNTFHGGILMTVLLSSIFIIKGKNSSINYIIYYSNKLYNLIPIYPLIWIFYKSNIFGFNIDNNVLLLNNLSYYFLFIFLFKVYNYGFKFNKINIFILLNLLITIYINETRGAFLILFFYLLYIIYIFITKQSKIFKITFFAIPLLLITIVGIEYINEIKLIANELYLFSTNYSFSDMAESSAKDLNNIDSENSFSTLSRIGTNLLSINLYFKNIFFGIGYYPSHNLRFLGDGIHSFILYSLTSFGSFGCLFLISILKIIMNFFNTKDHLKFRFLIFLILYMLMNQLSPFILLLFITNRNKFFNQI